MLWKTIGKLEHFHIQPRTFRIVWFLVEQQSYNLWDSGTVQDLQMTKVSSEETRKLEFSYIREISPISE